MLPIIKDIGIDFGRNVHTAHIQDCAKHEIETIGINFTDFRMSVLTHTTTQQKF